MGHLQRNSLTMADFYYPELPDEKLMKNIETARQLMVEHPAYLLENPWGYSTEKLLTKWFITRDVQSQQQAIVDSHQLADHERFTDLESELKTLYGLLKAKKPQAGEDILTYAKAASGMLQKITTLQAQAANIKQVSDFQGAVFDIMKNVCSEEQRQEFLRRLGTLATGLQITETPEEDEQA